MIVLGDSGDGTSLPSSDLLNQISPSGQYTGPSPYVYTGVDVNPYTTAVYVGPDINPQTGASTFVDTVAKASKANPLLVAAALASIGFIAWKVSRNN